jgi:hypothetical protein
MNGWDTVIAHTSLCAAGCHSAWVWCVLGEAHCVIYAVLLGPTIGLALSIACASVCVTPDRSVVTSVSRICSYILAPSAQASCNCLYADVVKGRWRCINLLKARLCALTTNDVVLSPPLLPLPASHKPVPSSINLALGF